MSYRPDLKNTRVLALLLLLVFSAWLRWPFLSAGLPYFYDEDEAHHHNRTVNMVKAGTFDPEYFHKPSLHFYLRMPFIAAGFLSSPATDTAPRIENIKTNDDYGIANYSFTTSSPNIAKWNRLCSLLISLGVIALSFLIVFELYPSILAASFAGLIVALSPDMLIRSSTVAVDMLMTLNCLLASLFALRAFRRKSTIELFLSAAFAGLALSSKYNALPIILVPFLSCFFVKKQSRIVYSFLCLGISAAFFLLASPYILAHIPTFLNQLAYERWHYGVAGHEGHSAEPGIAQFVFYLRWLSSSAIGYLLLTLACVATMERLLRRDSRVGILLIYPFCFFLYMCAQRVNFERNMISVIPYLAITAGLSLVLFRKLSSKTFLSKFSRYQVAFAVVLMGICLLQPASEVYSARTKIPSMPESREVLWKAFQGQGLPGRTGLAGELWLRPELYALPKAVKLSQKDLSLAKLQQMGLEYVLLGNLEDFSKIDQELELVNEYAGQEGKQRILRNPKMRLYRVPTTTRDFSSLRKLADQEMTFARALKKSESGELSCRDHKGKLLDGEEHCWTKRRLVKISTPGIDPLRLEVASPWDNQALRLLDSSGKEIAQLTLEKAWQWKILEIPSSEVGLYLETNILQSPKDSGAEDARTLGIALR